MKRYYNNLDLEAMHKFDLSPIEWMICEDVEFACKILDDGEEYSNVKRQALADHHKLSYDHVKKMVRSLVDRKFLKANSKHELKIGELFKKALAMNQMTPSKEERAKQKADREARLKELREKKAKNKADRLEQEFGQERVSAVQGKPTMNEVKAESVAFANEKGKDKEFGINVAEDFWLKQEESKWKAIKGWRMALERAVGVWVRNSKGNKKPKPKKIVTPRTTEQMVEWIANLSDKGREKLKREFSSQDGTITIHFDHIGLPKVLEHGEYCSEKQTENVLKHYLNVFEKELKGRVS